MWSIHAQVPGEVLGLSQFEGIAIKEGTLLQRHSGRDWLDKWLQLLATSGSHLGLKDVEVACLLRAFGFWPGGVKWILPTKKDHPCWASEAADHLQPEKEGI